jgi:hypothetical protein
MRPEKNEPYNGITIKKIILEDRKIFIYIIIEFDASTA